MRMHFVTWPALLVSLMLLTGCVDQRDAAPAPAPVAPTPPTVAETKASADVAKETITTLQLTNAGLIKTAADADTQIAKLNAQLLANQTEQAALKTQNKEILGAIKIVTAEKQTIIEAHDALVTHLVAGMLLLASVILGVYWWFAPPLLKSTDGKAALVAAGSGAVLYVVAAYITWIIWVGLAILAGIGIYVLQRSHLMGNAFAGLIKDGHVLMADLKRAGWVQAVIDEVNAVLVKLHIEHALPVAPASAPAAVKAPAPAQSIPPATAP